MRRAACPSSSPPPRGRQFFARQDSLFQSAVWEKSRLEEDASPASDVSRAKPIHWLFQAPTSSNSTVSNSMISASERGINKLNPTGPTTAVTKATAIRAA